MILLTAGVFANRTGKDRETSAQRVIGSLCGVVACIVLQILLHYAGVPGI